MLSDGEVQHSESFQVIHTKLERPLGQGAETKESLCYTVA